MKRILLIHGGRTAEGTVARIERAVAEGVNELADDIELRRLPALQADIDDLLWCNGLLIVTPEKFGYLAGVVKDFLDRTYYPAQGKVNGLPYALFVSAGNDGTGAVHALERIAIGYGWNRIAEALIVRGEPDEAALLRCRELAQTMAAGLSCGIF
jgi:multimeric flavodoxin WrbA